MNIVAPFTFNGTPATGLIPTIRIRNVITGVLIITDELMVEIGDGFYKYDFVGYDSSVDYAIRCDGGNALPGGERYIFAGNENYKDDIVTPLAKDSDMQMVLGLVHKNCDIINTVFDSSNNLQSATMRIFSDPASVGTNNNIIAQFEITADTVGTGQFTSWKQVQI